LPLPYAERNTMPNWCFNRLTVLGPGASRRTFADEMQRTAALRYPGQTVTFTFNHAFPMPADLVGTKSPRPLTATQIVELAKQYNWDSEVLNSRLKTALTEDEEKMYNRNLLVHGAETWYEWCCKYWGTKWDASNPADLFTPRSVVYTFDTAWSPPENVIHMLAWMYPDLRFCLNYSLEGESGRFSLRGDPGEAQSFLQEQTNKAIERRMEKITA